MPGRTRKITDVPTRRGQAEELAEHGVSNAVASMVLDINAAQRHRIRVEYVRSYVHPRTRYIVGVLDSHGVGGRHDATGHGTQRHPLLKECGSGRKQARDGAAWTAAIREATEIDKRENVWLTPSSDGGGLEENTDSYTPLGNHRVGNPEAPSRWVRSYALATLSTLITGLSVRGVGGDIETWGRLAENCDYVQRAYNVIYRPYGADVEEVDPDSQVTMDPRFDWATSVIRTEMGISDDPPIESMAEWERELLGITSG